MAMTLIGSYAAELRGAKIGRKPTDIDVIGTEAELAEFRRVNAAHITFEERIEQPISVHFHLQPGLGYKRVEFHVAELPSDRMLLNIPTEDSSPVLDSVARLASANVLYLTKRSHLNFPKDWEKHFVDMLRLMEHATAFSDAELEYYRQRKVETEERYRKLGSRFSLNVSNDEFFRVSNHIRTYVHDDIHKAIAFEKGKPLYERCKKDLSSARLERDLFEALPREDQIRLPQEEFIVIGIERFYLKDRRLPKNIVYARGLMKTVKDLCRGWFQDFCLDNMRGLAAPPDHDFLGRFQAAEQNGELRLLEQPAKPRQDPEALRYAQKLRQAGMRAQAEMQVRELLENDPNDAAALHELGLLALLGGKPEDAEQWIRKSVGIDPGNAEAWNSLGVALLNKNDLKEGIVCFRSALSRRPNFVPALMHLGIALEKQGSFDEAISAYRQAMRLNPNLASLRERLERVMTLRRHQPAV